MIRIATVLFLCAFCSGCRDSRPKHASLLCECFAFAAYDVVAAEHAADLPAEQKCCGDCGKNGLPKGKVMSGDEITVVPCPCSDSCECKQK